MTTDEAFQKLKSNLELSPSFSERITTHHNAVRGVFENLGYKTKLIGSLQRKTRIQPRKEDQFDIDILIKLGEFHRWASDGVTPSDAMTSVQDTLEESDRYSDMNPQPDEPAISFIYPSDNIKVEFVPAYLDMIGEWPDGRKHEPKGRAYWVPKNGRWELADYDYEANHVTEHNKNTDEWFIPTIKMLKAVNRLHFPDITTYHLEVIGTYLIPILIEAKKQHNIPLSYSDLIADFFEHSDKFLEGPIKMDGSNSPPVSLDPLSSISIRQKIKEISESCKLINSQTDENEKLRFWGILFGEPFPV